MRDRLFSPGKLLLTSEYVVLDGALALAIPTKWGQEFFFEEIHDQKSVIHWQALHEGQPWLTAKIDYQKGEIIAANIRESAEFMLKVLMKVKELSPTQLQENSSYSLMTNLQFPANFGLGSSSTLMNNLAEWASIDAFELDCYCLGGSGYDVAVAKEKSAILYQRADLERKIQPVLFDPDFKDQLIFIHLNKKQNSREGIRLYRSKEKSESLIEAFSEYTREISQTSSLEKFSELMSVHEKKLSQFLNLETAKEKYFENCPTFVKSLGAWGGDFVMSCEFPGFEEYFRGKGFPTLFSYEELIH